MKPGIKRIISGALICIFGTVVVPLAVILPIILEKSHETQFMIPGTQMVNVEKPGRYYLWNDFRTVYDGKSYNRSENIPDGLEIKIKSDSGVQFSFINDTTTTVSTKSNGSKNSIGYVEIEKPGKVEIDISGGDEQRVFSFGPSDLLKMVGTIFGAIALAGLVTLSGIGITILGAVRLVKSNRKIVA